MNIPEPAELDDLLALACSAAGCGGQIAADGFGRQMLIERKADFSEVTEYDRAAELAVIEHIRAARPDDLFLGEEAVDNSAGNAPDALCWVIDPIDGTRNFTRQCRDFACCVGVMSAGQPLAGAVYQPLVDELFRARVGGGAFCNDRPLAVNPATGGDRSARMLLALPSKQHENSAAWVDRLVAEHVIRNYGSASLHLVMVAAGRVDAALLNDCKLWDIAAAAAIVMEAGAVLTDLKGSPRFPVDPAAPHGQQFPTLAGSPVALERVMEARSV